MYGVPAGDVLGYGVGRIRGRERDLTGIGAGFGGKTWLAVFLGGTVHATF